MGLHPFHVNIDRDKIDDAMAREWWRISQQLQLAANAIFQQWLVWHVERDSRAKLVEFLDEYAAWKKADKITRGPQPKSPIEFWPKELASKIDKYIRHTFNDVHGRVLSLLLNRHRSDFATRKSSNSKLKGWQAVLLGFQQLPQFSHPQPIPIDRCNSSLVLGPKGQPILNLRIDRIETGQTSGRSTRYEVPLIVKATQRTYYQAVFDAIDDPKRLRGSMILYDTRKKQWRVCLTCEKSDPAPANVDPDKTIWCWPSSQWPWMFYVDGQSRWLGHSAAKVRHNRERVLLHRWSCNAHYRAVNHNGRGHGRGRAIREFKKVERRWTGFCKWFNQEAVDTLVALAVDRGCGRIVILPSDSLNDLLSMAGKVPGRRDASSWPYHQFAKKLNDKCAQLKIEVLIQTSFSKPKTAQREETERVT